MPKKPLSFVGRERLREKKRAEMALRESKRRQQQAKKAERKRKEGIVQHTSFTGRVVSVTGSLISRDFKSLQEILPNLTPKTKGVRFISCDYTDRDNEFPGFAESLIALPPTVTTFEWQNSRLTSASFKQICDSLSKNPNLTDIRFIGCPLSDAGAKIVAETLHSLLNAHNSNLTRLILQACEIGHAVSGICDCLLSRPDSPLIALDLSANKLTAADFRGLGRALKENKSLTALNLNNNDPDTDSLCSFFHNLEDNNTLAVLGIVPDNWSKWSVRDSASVVEAATAYTEQSKEIVHIESGGFKFDNCIRYVRNIVDSRFELAGYLRTALQNLFPDVLCGLIIDYAFSRSFMYEILSHNLSAANIGGVSDAPDDLYQVAYRGGCILNLVITKVAEIHRAFSHNLFYLVRQEYFDLVNHYLRVDSRYVHIFENCMSQAFLCRILTEGHRIARSRRVNFGTLEAINSKMKATLRQWSTHQFARASVLAQIHYLGLIVTESKQKEETVKYINQLLDKLQSHRVFPKMNRNGEINLGIMTSFLLKYVGGDRSRSRSPARSRSPNRSDSSHRSRSRGRPQSPHRSQSEPSSESKDQMLEAGESKEYLDLRSLFDKDQEFGFPLAGVGYLEALIQETIKSGLAKMKEGQKPRRIRGWKFIVPSYDADIDLKSNPIWRVCTDDEVEQEEQELALQDIIDIIHQNPKCITHRQTMSAHLLLQVLRLVLKRHGLKSSFLILDTPTYDEFGVEMVQYSCAVYYQDLVEWREAKLTVLL